MSKASSHSPDMANKGISITRSAFRAREYKKTMPKQRHAQQDKTRANIDVAITREVLRARDHKKTMPTRNLYDKTSMPSTSRISSGSANKDTTRGALCSKGRKTKRPKRHNVQQDKTSMSMASSLSQDRTHKDTTKTRSARRTREGKTTRPKRCHAKQNKTSMSKIVTRSSNRANTKNAITHSARRTREDKTTRPKRHNAQQGKTNTPMASSLSQDRTNKDIVITQRARRTKCVRPPSSPSPSNVTATKLADIDVESAGRITGSAIMTDTRLICVDNYKHKLNLIDTKANQLLTTLDVSTMPFDACDVAAVNKHQAAVTLHCSNKILFVKVTDTLVKEREITVSGHCYGVAYNRDQLFVTYRNNPRLEILDLRGTLITTIEYDTDGNKLFQFPLYVCISMDGDTVYVSDWERHTVTSLTLDGVVKAVYKDEELDGPANVCTDHHGNVYVCGVFSRNVHMLTSDCMKVKVILTQADGLDFNVWSVSHCQDTNRLFIGMDSIYSNTLKCYQLA